MNDPDFVGLVSRACSAELNAKAAHEVFLVRIDNWFDVKWLNFSGEGRVAFGWYTGLSYNPDTSLDEFRQLKKTFPPFSPNRVVAEYYFTREENGTYSPHEGSFVHSQERGQSSRNLHRRVAAFSDSALFVWFSSKTKVNGRGSLMVYRANGTRVTSWYSSFSKENEWRLLRTERIGREQLRTWIMGSAFGFSQIREVNQAAGYSAAWRCQGLRGDRIGR